MDLATTIPPRLITATSVVPPPMSTIRDPDGSLTGRPAPIAAAIGSSIRRAQRAPALMRGVPHGPLLHLGDTRGDPDQHPRPGDAGVSVVHLLDEVMNHLLGDVEVADHPVAQGPDGDDVGGSAANHAFRLGADGEHPLGPRVHGDDARLADDDPPVTHRDERVGGAEVDADVVGEQAEQAVEDAQDASGSCWRGLVGPGTLAAAAAREGCPILGAGATVRPPGAA